MNVARNANAIIIMCAEVSCMHGFQSQCADSAEQNGPNFTKKKKKNPPHCSRYSGVAGLAM